MITPSGTSPRPCSHCHGQKQIKAAGGVLKPCPVCKGTGTAGLQTK